MPRAKPTAPPVKDTKAVRPARSAIGIEKRKAMATAAKRASDARIAAEGSSRTADRRIPADPNEPKYLDLKEPTVRAALLAGIALCGNVSETCEKLKVSLASLYELRRQDPEFKIAIDNARSEAVLGWEDEVSRRAFRGIQKPVYQGGELVGHVTEYSDKLAEFLMKGYAPARHNPVTRVEAQVQGTMHATLTNITDEELDKKINGMLAGLGAINLGREEYAKIMGKDKPAPKEKS